jgi:hypothetical protein
MERLSKLLNVSPDMGWVGLIVSRPSNASLAQQLRFNLQVGSPRRPRQGRRSKMLPGPCLDSLSGGGETLTGDEGNKEYPCVSA